MNGNRCYILQLWVHIGRDRDPELLQHVFQALYGKRRLSCLVTRSSQTHNQTVADEFITAHARNIGDIFHPSSLNRHAQRGDQKRAHDGKKPSAVQHFLQFHIGHSYYSQQVH